MNRAAEASRRLRSRLVAALVGFNLLVLALSSHSVYQSRRQHEARAQTLTQNIAVALDESLSNSVDKVDFALHTVVDEIERQLASGAVDERAMTAFLTREEKRLPEVEAFRVADADGRVFFGKDVHKAPGASWADRGYFAYHRAHDDGSLQITKPMIGRVVKRYIIGFSRRYNHPDGTFAGVVSAPIAVDHLAGMLSRFDLGKNGTLILRDSDLGLIARLPVIPDQPIGQVGNSGVSPELRKLVASGVKSATYYTPVGGDGFQRIATFRCLTRAPMMVLAASASDDYLASWVTEVYKTFGMAAGFLLLSVVLGGGLLRHLAEAGRRGLALAERKAQLQTLIEVVPDSIQFKDAEGRWLLANSVCQLNLGLAGDDWQGRTDGEIAAAHPRLAAALASSKAGDDAAWVTARLCRSEEQCTDGEGRLVCHEVIRVPLFDEAHRPQAMVVLRRDISERKRSEVELEQHRRNLEALVEQRTTALLETEARASHIVQSSAAGLFGLDVKGIVTFMNPAACEMLGYSAEQVIGLQGHELMHHTRPDGTPYPLDECPSQDALRSGQKLRVDNEVYWHADGHAIPVMYAIHPMVQNGVTTGAVISCVDMSAQRAAARALERAVSAAENLARVRSEFLANMSHEIRTPLSGVLGFAEIGYRNYQNAEKAREAFSRIQTSGKRLLGVIEDILDFSKIEAGKLAIEQTAVDIGEVIEHAIELIRDRALARGLELRVERAPDLPSACISDPLRMGQVLLNVLTNAVKFTEQGSVVLAVSLQDGKLVFSVSDTGIGMDGEQIEELFNPFQQADPSITRRFGGSGLGLAICKRIIDLMRGDIRVRSKAGTGTTVEFRLPYVPAARPAGDTAASRADGAAAELKQLTGVSILIAEDDPVTREVLAETLIDSGAHVVTVCNGREAVDRVVNDGSDAFDVVLMDIQMPEMDGYEAARRILELAPDLPVLAQTAHAFSEERERCMAAGMVGHIAKPIRPAELVKRVLEHVPVRAGA